ncbi:hypothetical protein CVT26_008253 [Gymnopilus dilepis]|uniref:Uncharacterized protein n=1 Tax=Gymnopilus dilepis TaxID=231916 RepID=A0A409XXB3_9AGAR|nr:hypothetical protein CVT26_008253 [Gymnopilus dilepis]
MNSSSTSLLLPSSHKSTPKDWETSFGQLSSSYGFSGSVPSVPPKSKKSKSPSPSSVPSPFMQSVSSHPSVSPSTKDYEKSFGQLSSMYGFGGGVPSLPPKVPKQVKQSVPPSSSTVFPPLSGKDYQTTFGQLSSTHGFGTSVSPTSYRH